MFCNPVSPHLALANTEAEESRSQFALWVAFFEIYNECVYDLLQPSLCTKSKKRSALRVCDDGAGNAYVKGMRRVLSCVGSTRHWYVEQYLNMANPQMCEFQTSGG